MRRHLFHLCLAFLTGPIWADVVPITPAITAATLYPDSARITRTATLDLPSGRHDLVFDGLPEDVTGSLMWSLPEGLTLLARQSETVTVPTAEILSGPIKPLYDRYAGLQEQVRALKARIAGLRLDRVTFEAQQAALAAMAGAPRDASPTSDEIAAIAEGIATLTRDSGARAIESDRAAEALEEQLELLTADLEAAQDAIERIGVPDFTKTRVILTVQAAAPVTGTARLTYLDQYSGMYWQPTYSFHLTTAEPASLVLDRGALISVGTAEDWIDVDLTLSTLRPTGRLIAPSVWPQRRTISPLEKETYRALAEPVIEAPVIVEEVARPAPTVAATDLGVTYGIPDPFTARAAAGPIDLWLGRMELDVTLRAVAIPGLSKTAYLQAFATNPSQIPLPAAAQTQRFVDGNFVGEDRMPDMRPGDDVELGFGPLQTVSVAKVTTRRNTGDTGIVTRQNRETMDQRIDIANHGQRSWDIRVVDAVPYSEEDDLKITWTADPSPTITDLDDKRGILAWDGVLAPGESRTISLETDITWPLEMEMR